MVTHLKSLVLSIVMIFPIIGESTVVAARAPSSDPNAPDVNHVTVVEAKPVVSAEDDASRYLNAVREFADNVLKYGRDTYGPKHTPLFVDGLMVRDPNNPDYGKDGVFKPVEWIAPNGDSG